MKENNRNATLFHNTTNTNSINLGITTLCSMKCPKCSINVPELMKRKEASHIPMKDIIEDLYLLTKRGFLQRIHLTGGEPTLHPEFEEIVRFLSEETFKGFSKKFSVYLTIETNGWGYEKYRNVFPLFNKVFITHYKEDYIYSNSPDNTAIIEMAETDLGRKLIREDPVIHKESHIKIIPLLNKKETPCSKWSNPGLSSGYYDRKIYSCCVSFGIDRTLGIRITENWRDEITKLKKGCNSCCYQGT